MQQDATIELLKKDHNANKCKKRFFIFVFIVYLCKVMATSGYEWQC